MTYEDLKLLNEKHKNTLNNRLNNIKTEKEKQDIMTTNIFRICENKRGLFIRNEYTKYRITSIYNILRLLNENMGYITNLSVLCKHKDILSKYLLDINIMEAITTYLRNDKNINGFYIIREPNIKRYLAKVVLSNAKVLINDYDTVLFVKKNNDYILVSDCNLLYGNTDINFFGLSMRKVIINNLDTSFVTILNNCFRDCTNLESIELYNWNLSNVHSMKHMFRNCKNLNNLVLDFKNTNSCTHFSGMFLDCMSLTKLDLSHFNVEGGLFFNVMFQGCKNLIELNISNWCAPKAYDAAGFLLDCENLEILDMKNFVNSWPEDMYCPDLYTHCNKLKNSQKLRKTKNKFS